eukprot:TRINITY_DN3797_c0_g1_i1.p1 TRINITY_DN3797_c0_g1~~TRINITY_DN3797_c0_g1_i1.p1  ORF type:complete len:450 (+),score=22.42 TRINITY_DN3797_c0_g1_i1:116-1465(+)
MTGEEVVACMDDSNAHSPRWASQGRRPSAPARQRQSVSFGSQPRPQVPGRPQTGTSVDVTDEMESEGHMSRRQSFDDSLGGPLPEGTLVEVHSLKQATTYNGLWGRVMQSEGELYQIKFRPPHGVQRLRRENLRVMQQPVNGRKRAVSVASSSAYDTAGYSQRNQSCLKGKAGMTKAKLGPRLAPYIHSRKRQLEFIALLRGPIGGGLGVQAEEQWGGHTQQAESISLIVRYWMGSLGGRAKTATTPVLTFDRRHEVVSDLPGGNVACEEVDALEIFRARSPTSASDASSPPAAVPRSRSGSGSPQIPPRRTSNASAFDAHVAGAEPEAREPTSPRQGAPKSPPAPQGAPKSPPAPQGPPRSPSAEPANAPQSPQARGSPRRPSNSESSAQRQQPQQRPPPAPATTSAAEPAPLPTRGAPPPQQKPSSRQPRPPAAKAGGDGGCSCVIA